MTENIFLIIFLLIPIFGLVYLIYSMFVRTKFDYDKNNPYRRYCKKCGQQQDMYSSSFASNYTWWEDALPIKNEKCTCHKYNVEDK